MSYFQQRLVTKAEYIHLFLVCAFPVHLWAIITLLKWVSTLILPLNAYQIASVVAYVLVFALLETLLIFSLLFILSMILPPGFFRPYLVSAGAVIVLLASISAAVIHLYEIWEFSSIKYSLWASLWVVIGLIAIALFVYWLRRYEKVEGAIHTLVDRLAVLSTIYLVFDFFGVFIVLFRNLL